jgi:hypothetical protein
VPESSPTVVFVKQIFFADGRHDESECDSGARGAPPEIATNDGYPVLDVEPTQLKRLSCPGCERQCWHTLSRLPKRKRV